MMSSYFDEMLLINYDHFSSNQLPVLQGIMDFLEIETTIPDGLRLEPVNSSADAIFSHRTENLKVFAAFLPRWLKERVRRMARKRIKTSTTGYSENSPYDIGQYLQNSLRQYEQFRDHIGREDILWLKK